MKLVTCHASRVRQGGCGDTASDELVLALPWVDPRQLGAHVARQAGGLVVGAEERARDARHAERADHVDVAHHKGEGAAFEPGHQALGRIRPSSDFARST